MSLANEYTDNFFIGESSILDAHLRLLFRAYHYETPCITVASLDDMMEKSLNTRLVKKSMLFLNALGCTNLLFA
jgi:hypothetical protein